MICDLCVEFASSTPTDIQYPCPHIAPLYPNLIPTTTTVSRDGGVCNISRVDVQRLGSHLDNISNKDFHLDPKKTKISIHYADGTKNKCLYSEKSKFIVFNPDKPIEYLSWELMQ